MEVRALYSWPDHYLTSQFANEIGFFQRVFAEKPSPSCILFRIWLIWLDSFDQEWNSHYDGNGLARQFWQMESALKLAVFGMKLFLTFYSTYSDFVLAVMMKVPQNLSSSPTSFMPMFAAFLIWQLQEMRSSHPSARQHYPHTTLWQ